MAGMVQDDAGLKAVLQGTKVIALVGASAKPERPSHRVMGFLQGRGYRVLPVNPGLAGQQILGEPVWDSLGSLGAEMGDQVDMIDIFRRSEAVPGLLQEALEALPGLKTVWMQLGVISPEAAESAAARGLDVVMDHCPAIEYPRLIG